MADRPRDRLGRPTPDLANAAPPIPNETRSAAEALAVGRAFFNQGFPFLAHEVFEQQWRQTEGSERAYWRALAQFAAGVTHLLRGNAMGGNRLLLRAADGLAVAGHEPIDLHSNAAALISWCNDLNRDLSAIPTFGSAS